MTTTEATGSEVLVTTSFGQEGYHHYGKRFIETYLDHCGHPLLVFYEKGIPSSCPKDDRIEYFDLFQFKEVLETDGMMAVSDPIFRGLMKGDKGPVYNYRYDANKFFRKVFAYAIASTTFAKGRLVAWFDADVQFKKEVPSDFLPSLLGPGEYMAYIGREWLHSECGFMLFDTKHPAHQMFMLMCVEAYRTKAFRYLGELHDCYVFDFFRSVLRVPANNLTRDETGEQPFDDSVLGEYATHLKGSRKYKEKAA